MALLLTQTVTAISPGLTMSFLATGGTSPYVYSVRANGAGGSIDASMGVYTAPNTMSEDPAKTSDIVQVRDSAGKIATASILVGTPLLLVCDIIQNQMGLAPGRTYLWDQKIFEPIDSDLYVAVSMPICKPFGSIISYDGSGSGLNSNQSVNMLSTVDLDIISRGPAARDQKELVLMTLNSVYSEQQQEINSFQISRLTTNFINLSDVDGSAIPYRYRLSFQMTYAVQTTKPVSYFNVFQTPTEVVNS